MARRAYGYSAVIESSQTGTNRSRFSVGIDGTGSAVRSSSAGKTFIVAVRTYSDVVLIKTSQARAGRSRSSG